MPGQNQLYLCNVKIFSELLCIMTQLYFQNCDHPPLSFHHNKWCSKSQITLPTVFRFELPNFEQLLDYLWPAESEREKELCGMNNRTVGFAFTTYSVLCLLLGYMRANSKSLRPMLCWKHMKVFFLEHILDFTGDSETNCEGEWRVIAPQLHHCWNDQVKLSPAKPDRRWVEGIKFIGTYGKLCSVFFFQHASEK